MGNLTTIQIQKQTKQKLEKLKEYRRETYDELLNKIIAIVVNMTEDDEGKLRPEVIKEIEEARKELKDGKGIPLSKVMKELGIKT
jgi:undecaprenyl pyrophosphate synthase